MLITIKYQVYIIFIFLKEFFNMIIYGNLIYLLGVLIYENNYYKDEIVARRLINSHSSDNYKFNWTHTTPQHLISYGGLLFYSFTCFPIYPMVGIYIKKPKTKSSLNFVSTATLIFSFFIFITFGVVSYISYGNALSTFENILVRPPINSTWNSMIPLIYLCITHAFILHLYTILPIVEYIKKLYNIQNKSWENIITSSLVIGMLFICYLFPDILKFVNTLCPIVSCFTDIIIPICCYFKIQKKLSINMKFLLIFWGGSYILLTLVFLLGGFFVTLPS